MKEFKIALHPGDGIGPEGLAPSANLNRAVRSGDKEVLHFLQPRPPEVLWPKSPEAFKGKPVRLEFKVRNAALFGFQL